MDSSSSYDAIKLPLTPMDAGLLREIAAKVDNDCIDTGDAMLLRGIADSVDALLEWCEGARSKEEVEEILFGDTTKQSKDAAKEHIANLRSIAAYLDPKIGTHTEGYRMAKRIDDAIAWIEKSAGLK